MQKGVLDGITFPVFVSADFKLYEVGKAMTRPDRSGSPTSPFIINVRKLDSLSPELQKILLEEARKIVGRSAREALDKLCPRSTRPDEAEWREDRRNSATLWRPS